MPDGEFGDHYKFKSYETVLGMTQDLARGIRKFGLSSKVKDNDFDIELEVLGICSVNREEWMITDLASNLLSITTVPLYETLGDDMLQLILS